ncbi:cysteine protease StiP family protein [Escherichia albertii]|nr:cysteine protease StiP family protein [Escherichia albertii]
MSHITPFSGSYKPDDVQFLLNPIDIEMTPIDIKEKLIQSGKMHYSDMLSQEPEPTHWHLNLFARALDSGAARLAQEISQLARELIRRAGEEPIVLVSLVRAGVPLGVMLHQALRVMGKQSYHYGISIIRDRGIDIVALKYIESRHDTTGIVFVDGWTGKGAITRELSRTLKGRAGYPEIPRLVVLADPCGCAWLAASNDDWLIPFGIMGAPVSGLISRSVWAKDGLHGCVVCDHLRPYECSQMLVDTVAQFRKKLDGNLPPPPDWNVRDNMTRWKLSQNVIQSLAIRYGVDSINRIKPGIAEATRAILRRVPDHVFVRQLNDPDVSLLVGLAKEKGIQVTEAGDTLGQYRAITIIKKVC